MQREEDAFSPAGRSFIPGGQAARTGRLAIGLPVAFEIILLEDVNGKFFGDAGYAGLSPDQVIINAYGGANLTAGPTRSVNNQGDGAHPNNVIYGTFLNPNGPISMVNTRFIGRDFGSRTRRGHYH